MDSKVPSQEVLTVSVPLEDEVGPEFYSGYGHAGMEFIRPVDTGECILVLKVIKRCFHLSSAFGKLVVRNPSHGMGGAAGRAGQENSGGTAGAAAATVGDDAESGAR